MRLFEIFNDLQYRSPTSNDVDALIELKHQLSIETKFMPETPTKVREQRMVQLFTEEPNLYQIALVNDKIVGYIALKVTNDTSVLGLGVLKQYNGKGIGSQLLKSAITQAKKKYLNSITLHVDKTNDNAINLYKKYGFYVINSVGSEITMELEL